MTDRDLQRWRIEAAQKYRMDSAAVIDDPDFREWAQGRARLADEIQEMSDGDLILRIEADERLIDKMTSGA